ncbi:MAG: S9 family peptidase [Sinobacteraceae bacterium]|nr:S9 family peptidase [Nevskiaceae bacterium]
MMARDDRASRAARFLAVLCTLLGALMTPSVHAEKLTIERIFSAPDLSGANLRSPEISPDGHLVTYLRGSEQDKDRLDLWAYDLKRRKHRLLLDSRRLAPGRQALSAEEAQRRERQRTSALSGILEYEFSADARYLLVPLDGELYVYDLRAPAAKAVRKLPKGTGVVTDAHFSPGAHYVSFIRDQNLFVLELASGQERAITQDGSGPISYGVAEFVAQEEMGRTTGYWWAPDEGRIAFTRVDESGVPEVQRFEIYANRTTVIKQRYPAAGGPNVHVQLYVAPVAAAEPSSARIAIDLGPDPDIYLARVNWFPDSSALAVQRQSRDQKTLVLLHADPATGAARELLTEHSNSWVELNDNLTFLRRSRQFIWSSGRSGFHHLYLYDWDGQLLRPLTQGDWEVTGDNNSHGMRGVDEVHGLVYFMANAATPLERHLYSVSLADPAAPMQQITHEAGWHSVAMADNAQLFLDTFSSTTQPPTVRLRAASGAVLAELIDNQITPQHPYFHYQAEHVPVEFGSLHASDGQELYYELMKPKDLQPGRRYPVIVRVYGGPGVQLVRNAWDADARSNEGFIRQYFVQQGYVWFSLDNRGSGWRGEKFESAILKHLGSAEVDDQVAGVRFLKSLPYVDPTRIGVFGWSYGGYMALMCTLRTPGVFAAAIAGAPVTDWRLYDTHYTERYMDTPQANREGYIHSNVTHYAKNLTVPLLMMHGMADDNVLFANSTALYKVFQDLHKTFDIMVYPGSKHALLRHADTGPHGYQMIQEFFDRTLRRTDAQ